MHHTMHKLLAMLHSNDTGTQEEALLYIGLLLEIHTFNSREQSQYDMLLPDDVRCLVLDESQQATLVNEVCQVVGRDYPTTRMAIQAIRMTKPQIAFIPLLLVIRDKHLHFDTDSTRQALIGLERYLIDSLETPNNTAEKRRLMEAYDTFIWLQTILDADNPELKELAERVVRTMEGTTT